MINPAIMIALAKILELQAHTLAIVTALGVNPKHEYTEESQELQKNAIAIANELLNIAKGGADND